MSASHGTSHVSRILLLAASVLILGVFVFPLWTIRLSAPQYPQGLGLIIRVDRIEGMTPHDLQNINGLNHYIGMQRIEPDSIAELRYMKYIAAGLSVCGLVAAWSRRRWALVAWFALAVSVATIGVIDFYRWEYRYGHDLDPSAAIKLPGVSYQPPMFGTKQLANFRTTAWPGVGGVLAMLSVALGGVAVLLEMRRICSVCVPRGVRLRKPVVRAALVLLTMVSIPGMMGCARGPRTINFGTDVCDYCAMTISDDRHGAVFVTAKGRSYPFDSVECMLRSVMAGEKHTGVSVASWHVVDYANRGHLIDAAHATYLVSPGVPSPMGANLSGFADRAAAEALRETHGGDVYDWAAMSAYLQRWVNS